MKGFNGDPAEYSGAWENPQAEESQQFAGNPTPRETGGTEEYPAPKKRKKKGGGSSGLTRLASVFVVATVAVVAGTAMLSESDAAAEIVRVDATDTAVSYEVVVSTEGEEELSVILYNDFTRRSFPLASGVNSNVFEDLRADVEYTVAVVGNFGFGEKTLAERKIRTAAYPAHVPVTQWYGMEWQCRCAKDGNFWFRMDFLDEQGLWTEFEATLADNYGNTLTCTFGEDLHDWQKIYVLGGFLGSDGTFTVTCLSSETGERITQCEIPVKI